MRQVPLHNLVGGAREPRGRVGLMLLTPELTEIKGRWLAVEHYSKHFPKSAYTRRCIDTWLISCEEAMKLHDKRFAEIRRRNGFEG